MSSVESLVKRINSLLAVVEDKQQQLQTKQRVLLFLPIKEDEPQVPYSIEHEWGTAHFYVPDVWHGNSEVA